MIQVSPDDALSNVSKWFTLAGLTPPKFTISLSADRWVTYVLSAVIIANLIWFFWPKVKLKFFAQSLPRKVTVGDLIQVIAKAHVVKSAPKPQLEPPKPSEPEQPLELEKLYASNEDENLIWLRFDPDTKDRSDDLILILYGYKKILQVDEVSVSKLNTSLKLLGAKTSNESSFTNYFTIPHCDVLAKNYIHSRVSEKIRLSQGGAYKLLEQGEQIALYLVKDLIRRA